MSGIHSSYTENRLSVVVLGASGDLAKKKTYPSLLDLYANGFLPEFTVIAGYSRSAYSHEDFRGHIRPYLKNKAPEDKIEGFLNRCFYFSGSYDAVDSFKALDKNLTEKEIESKAVSEHNNRLFYFALPPNVFISTATCIRQAAVTHNGWNRIIVEKPFGHDLESAIDMNAKLGAIFTENEIYRIDHYLGKEMVQNLIMFRFGNTFLEPLMNRNHVNAVMITFKEDFGTGGRGGYFDNYGIIRDIMQNHLMQVLTLVAMEPPVRVSGSSSGHSYANFVRDAKVNVVKSMSEIKLEDIVLGQYVGNDKGDVGYLEDATVPAGSKCPTFCQAVLRVNNPRWAGVPFIMKAGKALDERKAEIRIQFKSAPGSDFMFGDQEVPCNELVMRLQPDEAVYFKINVKKPGLYSEMTQSELDLTYGKRYEGHYNPDAYTRLILDTLIGSQATFVRSDELENSWRIFDPVLTAIKEQGVTPIPYVYGSRGPAEADEQVLNLGVSRSFGYTWVKK